MSRVGGGGPLQKKAAIELTCSSIRLRRYGVGGVIGGPNGKGLRVSAK